MTADLARYAGLLGEVRARIAGAQIRASLAANRELTLLYWDIGHLIHERQATEGWGAAVIPRLARDLAAELPDARGFSERNLKRMVQYCHAYPQLGGLLAAGSAGLAPPGLGPRAVAQMQAGLAQMHAAAGTAGPAPAVLGLGPQPVAQLPLPAGPAPAELGPQAVAQLQPAAAALLSSFSTSAPADACASLSVELPWGHNVLLIQKLPDVATRLWYARKCLTDGWSRDVLDMMIKSDAHVRQGVAVTNFQARLPALQSDLARQTLKDPYVFDFLALDAGFRERELELGLLAHLERFLLELGVGFAFVGRQHRLTLGDNDFYLDLLFYHLKLRCFVVVDLKAGPFKPEYAGKMNFYLNLVDDLLRHPTDQPSIGLILCQDKEQLLAEYALRGLDKPIGVSAYELTRALPTELTSALPTIESIEAELSRDDPAGEAS